MTNRIDRRADSKAYELFMLALCVYALGALVAQFAIKLDPDISDVLDYADNAVCVIFLADFIYSLWAAEDRWRYLRTWGWLDLLSSIPTLDAARWGRLARIARVLRVLRGLRTARVLTSTLLKRRSENTFVAASVAALLLIVFCSVAILHFENDPESNIRTAEDAIWWAFATITTVGYGDRFPVTSEGRFVAGILMFSGVGLFGTFSAFLAAWLLGPEKDPADELAELRSEIKALRKAIEDRPQT